MAESMSGVKSLKDPVMSEIIQKSYKHYNEKMVGKDGRPLADTDKSDFDKDGDIKEKVTYSEAVSYRLGAAVLMGDKNTFDRIWLWTTANMQRKNISRIYNTTSKQWQPLDPSKKDNLFAWQFLPTADGKSGGVLTCYHFDPASDADQDIAAALLWADKKWGSSGKINYKAEALAILNDIWNKETKVINGKRILLGSDTQMYTKDPFTGVATNGINVSYFRPMYYEKLFAKADPDHNWGSMVAPAYEVIRKSETAVVHDESNETITGSVNLAPDWITMDAEGKIHDHDWVQNDYFQGGDAFRTHFWIALQHKLNPSDGAANSYCDHKNANSDFSPGPFLKDQLIKNGTVFSGYNIDGRVHWSDESLQTLGVYMAYFWASGYEEGASKLYGKLQGMYHEEGYWGQDPQNYYGQNWVWFSLFFMNEEGGKYPPAAASVKPFKFEVEPKAKPAPKVEKPKETSKIEAGIVYTVPAASWLNFNNGEKITYTSNSMVLNGSGNMMGIIHTLNKDVRGANLLQFKIKGSHTGVEWRRFKVAVKRPGQEIVMAEEQGGNGNTLIKFKNSNGEEVNGISPDDFVTAEIDLKNFDLSGANELILMLVGNDCTLKNVEIGPFKFIKK